VRIEVYKAFVLRIYAFCCVAPARRLIDCRRSKETYRLQKSFILEEEEEEKVVEEEEEDDDTHMRNLVNSNFFLVSA